MESLAQPRSAGEQLGEKEEREGQQERCRGRDPPMALGGFLFPLAPRAK